MIRIPSLFAGDYEYRTGQSYHTRTILTFAQVRALIHFPRQHIDMFRIRTRFPPGTSTTGGRGTD
eukprot:scaffold416407_cov26-Prasinocladus_malaysianus.AAC.1